MIRSRQHDSIQGLIVEQLPVVRGRLRFAARRLAGPVEMRFVHIAERPDLDPAVAPGHTQQAPPPAADADMANHQALRGTGGNQAGNEGGQGQQGRGP